MTISIPNPTDPSALLAERVGSEALLATTSARRQFVDGDGVHLIDADGKRYLDFVSGIAVNALGYGDAGLRSAMHDAADGLDSRLEPLRDRAGRAAGRRAGREVVRVESVLLQLGRGGERRRVQVRASLGAGAGERRSTRSSRCAARSTAGCSARSRRPTGPRIAIPFRPLAPGISIVERDIEDLARRARFGDDRGA